jgi:hypothetical protein
MQECKGYTSPFTQLKSYYASEADGEYGEAERRNYGTLLLSREASLHTRRVHEFCTYLYTLIMHIKDNEL